MPQNQLILFFGNDQNDVDVDLLPLRWNVIDYPQISEVLETRDTSALAQMC
jgi:hypothetical protein